MCEEPEEVMALFEYMCDFYTEVTRRIWPYVKPDVLTLMDDTAAWAAPFISREMYHDMVLPFHDRQAKFGRMQESPLPCTTVEKQKSLWKICVELVSMPGIRHRPATI